MSVWVDAHAHLDERKFDHDREEVLERASVSGVQAIVSAAVSLESCHATLKLAEHFPSVLAALGIHPQEVGDQLPNLDVLQAMLQSEKVVAVGEVGLDFYWDTTHKDNQREIFRFQIRLAEKKNLPLVIHSRSAHQEVMEILHTERVHVPVVWHCFAGDARELKEILKRGYFLSVGGITTFPKARRLRALLRNIPPERLLLETDSPYLSPQPRRGKRNEPAYLLHTAQCVAEERGTAVEEVRECSFNAFMEAFPGSRRFFA